MSMARETVPAEFEDETPQVDFGRLRKAAIIYLRDLEDKKLDGGPKLNVLRDALGSAEWKIVRLERRMWALGRGCPNLDYKKSEELAELEWEDLPNDVRKQMSAGLLQWLRDEE